MTSACVGSRELRLAESQISQLNRRSQVTTFAPIILLACTCIAPAAANASETASSKDADDIAAIRQVEKDMGDAMVAVDIDKLGRYFADDWATTVPAGKTATVNKPRILSDFKSGKERLESFELG